MVDAVLVDDSQVRMVLQSSSMQRRKDGRLPDPPPPDQCEAFLTNALADEGQLALPPKEHTLVLDRTHDLVRRDPPQVDLGQDAPLQLDVWPGGAYDRLDLANAQENHVDLERLIELAAETGPDTSHGLGVAPNEQRRTRCT